jgi:hypothetical protein
MTAYKIGFLNLTAMLIVSDAASYSDSFDFSLEAETATNVTSIINRLDLIAQDAANQTINAIQYSGQLSRQDYPYSLELGALREEEKRLRELQIQQLRDIEQSQNSLKLSLADLQRTTILENEKIQIYAEASITLARSATAAMEAQLESDAPNWQVADPENEECALFSKCGYLSAGRFVVALGDQTAAGLGNAVAGVLNFAAGGVGNAFDFLFKGPFSGVLSTLVTVAVIIGLCCCLVQCAPMIAQACKAGTSCCPKTDETGAIQHVSGISPSASHLLERLKQAEKASRFVL